MTDTFIALERAAERHREAVLNGLCGLVGIGLRTLQSRERTAETALRRAIVADQLYRVHGWKQHQVAAALNRTPRRIKQMLQKNRVTSPLRGKNAG